jgi:hypothetical protein
MYRHRLLLLHRKMGIDHVVHSAAVGRVGSAFLFNFPVGAEQPEVSMVLLESL